MSTPLKIIFAGTPDFAAQHLAALLNSNHDIVAVYTQPDRPAGRGKKLTASPVKALAQQHQIAVYQPQTLKHEDAQRELASLNADLMIVVAYGLLLPKAVLDTPRRGCINVHGSILPAWRGAAPIQRALWAGDNQTGVTIMQMDEGLDTGDMLHIATLPITSQDTSASLYEKLAELGPTAMLEVVNNIDNFTPTKQDDSAATYAKKLSKSEARINWHEDAAQIERNIRAFNPWPVAWFSVEDQNIKVWQASVVPSPTPNAEPGTIVEVNKTGITVATGNQALKLESLQIPGKKALPATDVINARQQWFGEGRLLSGPSD